MKQRRQRKESKYAKGCLLLAVVYFFLAGVFYYAAGDQLYERRSGHEISGISGDDVAPQVAGDHTVRQEFLCEMDRLEQVTAAVCTFARVNTGQLWIHIYDKSAQQQIFEKSWRMEELSDGQQVTCVFDKPPEGVRGHVIAVVFSSDGTEGNAVAPRYASAVSNEGQQLYFDDLPVAGTLCFEAYGMDDVWTGPHYWKITAAFGGLLGIICMVSVYLQKCGKKSRMIILCKEAAKYRFLMRQLVSRDFKIKYKRSVLGALWSFVNPLLTMSVQYVVFSTLFRVDIQNYPVYLLSGIVLFNFFTESTNMMLYAITGNAGLITKVYVPKYIYPVSKALSTGVNLLISLLPLVGMCLVTGVFPTKAWLLLPFDLLCLLVFCIGVGFILSAVMVFFRDLQFIWSVLTMVLTYATPVFYPETILSEEMRTVLNWNPLYHFITFSRMVIIEGISPQPWLYLKCGLFSAAFLLAGILVFHRLQDKFIFHI